MTSSLVGSEMCIRDRLAYCAVMTPCNSPTSFRSHIHGRLLSSAAVKLACLLYTSDAADDM
eukprot:10900238-Prorocentrum_lima.AAC.1